MSFLKRRNTLDSEDKIGSGLDLESGTMHEFNKPASGMWRSQHREHCCIYRVPICIRRQNPEAYTPQLVIIGPLHHSLKLQALKSRGNITNTNLIGYLNMEQHKKFYLAKFAERLEGKQTIGELRKIIEEEEEMIRASYSESTDWIESPQFVDMILHDSVFMIEYFLRIYYNYNATIEKTGDILMDDHCLSYIVGEDLMLLENQLPYNILEKLFNPIIPTLIPNKTLRELVIGRSVDVTEIRNNSKFRHFTDLLRLAHVDTLPQDFQKVCYKPITYMYTADKLDSGGVKFEAVKEKLLFDVRFEDGCLKVPCFTIGDEYETRIRNVMALEQCHYPYNARICNYVDFLDCLIDTHKDVELLVEKGIINNWIGENDYVAKMVNKLNIGMIANSHRNYYSDIADEINTYYENPINKSRALLKRVYFGNLWTGTATVAATFLLIMTLIQTVASIMQVFHVEK